MATPDTRNVDRFFETNQTITLGSTKQKLEVLDYLQRNIPDGLTELKALQKIEFSLATKYKWAWETATKIFNERRNNLRAYKDGKPAEYHIALIAYTLESPKFYFEFNAATRNLVPNSDFHYYPYKSFFKLLLLAILNVSGYPNTIPPGQELYRGVSGKINNVKVGTTVMFQHFVSTTRSEDIADTFAYNDVFVLDNVKSEKYIGLENHSYFYDQEQEVLVCPYVSYRIEKIQEKNNKRLIYLKAGHWDAGSWCTVS